MRTLLQIIVRNVVVDTTEPSSEENDSTVAPLPTSVHGIDSSMPGIADVGMCDDGNPAVYITQDETIRSAGDLERFRSTQD